MALSLTAEQKSLMALFTTRDKYIIPSYQRPYSWEYEECLKLYSDIIDAYNDRKDYFLGNVIISRSLRDANRPQVVDGQQRLLTLWLAFKALSVLLPDIKVLREVTQVSSWDGNTQEVKLESDIFEADDDKQIQLVAAFTQGDYENHIAEALNSQGEIRDNAYESRIVTNSLYFYKWYNDYLNKYGRDAVMNHLQYLLTQVSMLPIELTGNDQKEADDKALTIFETINNRGRDLSDADIFKAKLYRKGKTKAEQREFIKLWAEFNSTCLQQNMTMYDAFRFYSHVVRGEQGITSAEKSLRDFFIEDSNSPLNHKGYREVMTDLNHVLEELREIRKRSEEKTELGAWLQLIYAYSNGYPLYATLAYAYKYGLKEEDDSQAIEFLKSVVRYCYYQGSTSIVKFEVFNIIRQLFIELPIKPYYQKSIDENYFNNLGRLKYGYALLAHYLQSPVAIPDGTIDKLIAVRDIGPIESSLQQELYDHIDDLGNIIVLDVNKRNRLYPEKRTYYLTTEIDYLRSYLAAHPAMTCQDIIDRTTELKTILNKFFLEPQEESQPEQQ